MPKIWIVVVDAAQAHFFRKPNHHLEKIGDGFPANPQSDITNKNTGRMSNPGGGGGRHRMEAHEGAVHHDSEVFLKQVAAFLNDAVARKALDRLVLVAAPKALGKLRALLNKETHHHINAEINKDLTHLNEKELYDYLSKALWI